MAARGRVWLWGAGGICGCGSRGHMWLWGMCMVVGGAWLTGECEWL